MHEFAIFTEEILTVGGLLGAVIFHKDSVIRYSFLVLSITGLILMF